MLLEFWIGNLTYFLRLRLLNKLIKADKQDCSNVRPLCGWGPGRCGRGGLHIINITGPTVLGDATGSRSTIQTVAAGKLSQSQLLSPQKSAFFLDASCGENRCISNSGSSLEMKGKRCSARFGVKPALVCVACSKCMHFTWTDASIINDLYPSVYSEVTATSCRVRETRVHSWFPHLFLYCTNHSGSSADSSSFLCHLLHYCIRRQLFVPPWLYLDCVFFILFHITMREYL